MEILGERFPPDQQARVLRLTEERLEEHRLAIFVRTDRLFAWLMAAQWIAGIAFALLLSPRAWEGAESRIHVHVYAAILLGGAIALVPIGLAVFRSGQALTRHSIAAGQMLASALLIHLTGGRIETHFHVFGSLAFLAFYRDWRVLITATAVVALDHAVRGIYWPQSVYGTILIQPWRFFEHAGWVLFEDAFLIRSIRQSLQEMSDVALRRTQLEEVNKVFEEKVKERTAQLESAKAALIQSEKMSAVGQLAAGIAHEINNPLGIILGFAQSATRRINAPDALDLPLRSIEREALRCKNLVQNLLVFSRQGTRRVEDFKLDELIAETLEIVRPQARVRGVEIAPDLHFSRSFRGDRNQLQQVVINLCNNALDAMPNGGRIQVRTRDALHAGAPCAALEVEDAGCGIPAELRERIFDPFFTTKGPGKGTGLGLSLVYEIVQKHGGSIRVESSIGSGSTFFVLLPLSGTD